MAQASISNSSLFDQGQPYPHCNLVDKKYKAPPTGNFLSRQDLIKGCLDHMSQNGFPIADIQIDEQIHRFSIDSNKGKPDEWYVAGSKEFRERLCLWCVYGSWSNSKQYLYQSLKDDELYHFSKQEKLEWNCIQKERAEKIQNERKIRQDEAAKEAEQIWDKASKEPLSDGHKAYINLKGIKPYNVRFGNNPAGYDALIVPLRNTFGEIRSLQFISVGNDGKVYKTYLKNGEKKGLFCALGDLKKSDPCFIAEGYSTAASIHEATLKPVVIAFDCENIDPVIGNIRKKYSDLKITAAGDDDVGNLENPGRAKAQAASEKYNCKVMFPRFPADFRLANEKLPTDYNDLHSSFGIDEVKKQLTKKTGHLTTINIEDFLAREIPPRQIILSPWLPEQGLAMIFARAGIGKTFLALSIAYAIASGDSILKWSATKPRRVLYIDGEMPASTMQERLKKISGSFGKKPPDPSYLQLITPDFQEEGIRDLSTWQGQQDIIELLDNVDVVFIDNLSCLVRSGNENEAESWKPIQEWALALRKAGKAVIFIHHAGKSGKERGTSKKEDVLDSVLELRRAPDYSPEDGAKFQVHFTKSRSFEGDEATPFDAQIVTDGEGNFEWTYSDIDGDQYELAIRLHKEGLNQREIAKEIGKSLGTVNKLLKKAKAEGRVQ